GLADELSLQRDGLGARAADRFLKLQPMQKEERCASPVCRRASYVYGLLYEHDQLNRATHETLHELLALPGRAAIAHLKTIAKERRLVAADGRDAYVPNRERLTMPLLFVHGDESEAFKLEGTQMTVASLSETIDPELVSLEVVIGKDAAEDVFPRLRGFLQRIEAGEPAILEA